MPTPSELQNERPRQSLFGNYRRVEPGLRETIDQPASASADRDSDERGPSRRPLEGRGEEKGDPQTSATLQNAIDSAVARTFLYRFLAKAFEDAEPEGWSWLTHSEVSSALRAATAALSQGSKSSLAELGDELAGHLIAPAYDDFASMFLACFGHTVRGDCPMNEIEYGDIKADPLFQPHRLADLGAFYAAFGLELTPDAAQRQDHVSIELEFMSVLAAKEAYALEHQLGNEPLALLREAQKTFLREHLARWTPAFARRLAEMNGDTLLGALARFLGEWIQIECARFHVPPGSEDLLLRPVDNVAERLCDSCGIHGLPPGAVRTGSEA